MNRYKLITHYQLLVREDWSFDQLFTMAYEAVKRLREKCKGENLKRFQR